MRGRPRGVAVDQRPTQVPQGRGSRAAGQQTDGGGPVALQRLVTYGVPRGAAGHRASGESVRVVLHFDRDAVFRRGELPASGRLPRRLFLDLENARLHPSVPSTIPVAAGGLRRARAFALDGSTVRVSFDVEEHVTHRLFFFTNPYRIVMDFRAPQPGRDEHSLAKRSWTVVVDPGHGGREVGARGPNGLKESALTLDVAKRVRSELRRHLPSARVVLTRNSDRRVSLEERTAIANGYAADVFVSIHFNAFGSGSNKGGTSTFVLDTTDDVQALRLAARENNTSEREVTALQLVLASLSRKDQVAKSLKLARLVQRGALTAGRRQLPHLVDRGVRRALFFVLVGARMPAVLVEASFITDKVEAAALQTTRYRSLLAWGIARGVIRYLKRRR